MASCNLTPSDSKKIMVFGATGGSRGSGFSANIGGEVLSNAVCPSSITGKPNPSVLSTELPAALSVPLN